MSAFEVDIRPPHDPSTCQRPVCGRCKPSGTPALPSDWDGEYQGPTATPDPVVRSIGLPRHPETSAIAAALEDAAKAIRAHGLKAIDMASVLAANGYSGNTLGDGGSRGTDTTSGPERGVLADRGDRWDAADAVYAGMLRTAWLAANRVKAQTDELLRHASDVDPTPAGTGECRACARFVRPTKDRSSFRLRSGLCPSCYGAWCNYVKAGGPMMWSEWSSHRRESYTERNASGQIVKIHTPEPEEDGQSA